MPNASNANKKNQIQSLTGARFIAIIIIVISHFEFLQQYGKLGEIYWKFFHNATLGVDFFFVLSGFGLMLSNIQHDPEGKTAIGGVRDLIKFGTKHVRKIYPIYVFFLVTGIPYYFILELLSKGKTITEVILSGAFFLLLDLTLLQSMTGLTDLSHSFNGPCWFLSCMFCIYLISPLIIHFLRKHVKSASIGLIWLTITALLSAISAIVFSAIEKRSIFNDFFYSSPYRRVLYVVSGMLIAQIYSYIKNRNIQSKIIRLINKGIGEYFFIAISVIWFISRGFSVELLGRFVYTVDILIVSGDIFVLSYEKGKLSHFLSSKIMVYLGSISMYIFLSHYIIRLYVDSVTKKLISSSPAIGILEAGVILAASIVCSILINKIRTKRK